ncbi:MAG: hypothetical protein PHE03_10885 [Bacteroidales bacterium]|nr:hypothetical protein [Bacteroidales bacterium]MDD3892793.1 hypothetical protein [Bacteroidales bacterium]
MKKVATITGVLGVIFFSIVLILSQGESSNLTEFARGFITGISIVFIVALLVYLIASLIKRNK